MVGITGTGGSSLRNLSVTREHLWCLDLQVAASESVQITGILIDGAAKAGLLVSNPMMQCPFVQASFVSVTSLKPKPAEMGALECSRDLS